MKYKRHVFLLGCMISLLLGKEKQVTPREEAHLAIVAVGGRPEIEALAKGEDTVLPPQLLFTRSANGEKLRYVLGLNGAPVFQKVPAERALELKKKVEPQRSEQQHYTWTDPLLAGSRSILFLRPSNEPPGEWEGAPKMDLVNIDTGVLKRKNLCIKNFTKTKLEVKIGEKREVIPAESFVAIKITKNQQEYINLRVTEAKENKEILVQSAVKISPHYFNVCILYETNPKTNRGKKMGLYKATVKKPKRVTDEDR